jgi:tetratricopeptide (TPR) repeat protein
MEMMTKRWAPAALCCAVWLCTAGRASAADPDPQTVKQAQERLREGNRLFDAGNYEGARVAYEQSLVLVPHGSTYRNLGTTEIKLGDPVSGLKHLRLAMKAPDLAADRKAITKRDLDDAFAATGHIAVSTAAGATVTVDGNAVAGTAPFADQIDVTVGKHTLEARLGAQSARFDVDAKGGQVSSLELAITPAPPPALTPPVANAPPPPSSSGSLATMPEVPRQEGTPAFWNARREIGLVVGAAGAVGLGASAIFYGSAQSQGNKASSLGSQLSTGACSGSAPPAACGELQSTHNSQKTDGTLSGVFLGVGATALVAGALMFFWPSSSSGSTQTAFVPFFSPRSGGGLQLRQEF